MSQQRASLTTTLSFGLVETAVALYKTVDDPKDATWDTAGPSGGSLVREQVIIGSDEIYDPLEAQLEASVAAFNLDDVDLALPQDEPPPAVAAPAAIVETEPALFEVVIEDGEPRKVRIEPADVRRGKRLEDGTWVDLTEALDGIDAETKLDEVRVVAFVRREKVPRERVTGSYYVGARGSAKPLVLLREAMRERERVAVVKWGKIKNQACGILAPYRDGLILLQLSWAADVRPLPDDAKLPDLALSAAEGHAAHLLIDALSDSTDVLSDLIDDRRRLTADLLQKVENGEAEVFSVPIRPEAPAGKSMEELLTASLAAAKVSV